MVPNRRAAAPTATPRARTERNWHPETAPVASDAKINANRQNAKKSTGPKTAEGKRKASQNAITHGLTAQKHVVIPGEDPQAFQKELALWYQEQKPADMAQAALVECACRAAWKLRRSHHQEDAALAHKARHALDRFDIERQEEAERLGRLLTEDPANRCERKPPDGPRLQSLLDYYAVDPAAVVSRMQLTPEGINWLITRWAGIARRLEEEGFLHYPDKLALVRMLGRRHEDVLDDPVVQEVFLACRALHPQPWDVWDDCYQAALGLPNRPIYYLRVERLQKAQPASKEQAALALMRLVLTELDRLNSLREEVTARTRSDRSEAVARSLFDASEEGSKRLRYEAASSRELHRSLADLSRLRKEGGETEDEAITVEVPAPPPEPAPGPAPEPVWEPESEPEAPYVMPQVEAPAPVPAGETAARNEANPGWQNTPEWGSERPQEGLERPSEGPERPFWAAWRPS
jgi:hypothetical protein